MKMIELLKLLHHFFPRDMNSSLYQLIPLLNGAQTNIFKIEQKIKNNIRIHQKRQIKDLCRMSQRLLVKYEMNHMKIWWRIAFIV